VLQAQLQQAVAARLPAGATAPRVTVSVTDVVPLVAADPRGAGLAAAAFPLVLGGMLGGIGITLVLVGALRRLVALGVYVVIAGIAVAAVMQGWFGVLQGPYVLNAAVVALSLLAIGAPIVGFAALVGTRGVAIGPILFLLIANPMSSATQPIEFLPAPWGAIGQWFPPGAGATLVRDSSYFPDADTLFPWLVLACWAAAGVILALAGHFRQTAGATHEAIEEAQEAATV
ncbi:MAG TPA: ABC transporter permease, partial [Pseudolysinimonas sp.]|nr:ABC transporter permease [Pseudolysinimonas sp.]